MKAEAAHTLLFTSAFSTTFCPAGVPFPKNFMSVAKTILKRLFRVYAHIYHQHFDSVMQLQEEAHLNTSFKHFIFFVQVRLSSYNVRFSHSCVSNDPSLHPESFYHKSCSGNLHLCNIFYMAQVRIKAVILVKASTR